MSVLYPDVIVITVKGDTVSIPDESKSVSRHQPVVAVVVGLIVLLAFTAKSGLASV